MEETTSPKSRVCKRLITLFDCPQLIYILVNITRQMLGSMKYFYISELFVKDLNVARAIASEMDALKKYVITSSYNLRLAMYLAHQFQQKSLHIRGVPVVR